MRATRWPAALALTVPFAMLGVACGEDEEDEENEHAELCAACEGAALDTCNEKLSTCESSTEEGTAEHEECEEAADDEC